MKRLLLLSALLGSAASAKVFVVFRLATPPLPVEAGQEFTLCAANVGTTVAEIELQFVSVRTGAVVARREIALPPPGTGAAMPDPCLATDAGAVIAAGNPPGDAPLVVGLMILRRGLFGRPSAATASVEVTAAMPAGERRIIASIPLHLATMVNNRNTPIEVVH